MHPCQDMLDIPLSPQLLGSGSKAIPFCFYKEIWIAVPCWRAVEKTFYWRHWPNGKSTVVPVPWLWDGNKFVAMIPTNLHWKLVLNPSKKKGSQKKWCFVTFWFRGCGKEGNGYSWLSSERNPKGKELAAKSSTHHMSVTPHRRKQTLKGWEHERLQMEAEHQLPG